MYLNTLGFGGHVIDQTVNVNWENNAQIDWLVMKLIIAALENLHVWLCQQFATHEFQLHNNP